MAKIKHYDTGLFPYIMGSTDIKDKDAAVSMYQKYMFARTLRMFEWTGLPDTITAEDLELLIQCVGYAGIIDTGEDLFAVTGGLGGELSAYYRPTTLTVANAWLQSHKSLKAGPYIIGTDVAIVKNDCFYMGLGPINSRYATMIAENDVSIRLAQINTRRQSLISCQDGKTYKAAELYLEAVNRGDMGIILENGFMEGLKSQPEAAISSSTAIQNLIELQQYLKASWLNELGLNANYNMKRESVNSVEAQLGDVSLLPMVDQMLICREQGADEINRIYGTNIKVNRGSVWDIQRAKVDTPLDSQPEEENTDDNLP